MDCEPLAALAPDQAPEALQLVALVDVQMIDAAWPLVIELGLGLTEMVGSGVAAAASLMGFNEKAASAAGAKRPRAHREKNEPRTVPLHIESI